MLFNNPHNAITLGTNKFLYIATTVLLTIKIRYEFLIRPMKLAYMKQLQAKNIIIHF